MLCGEAIDLFHDEEDHERDDEEFYSHLNEIPDLDQRRASFLGGFEAYVTRAVEREEHRFEVDFAEQRAERRHDYVIHDGVHNFTEGTADDHADGEIDDVTAHREFPEFGDETFAALERWFEFVGDEIPYVLDHNTTFF